MTFLGSAVLDAVDNSVETIFLLSRLYAWNKSIFKHKHNSRGLTVAFIKTPTRIAMGFWMLRKKDEEMQTMRLNNTFNSHVILFEFTKLYQLLKLEYWVRPSFKINDEGAKLTILPALGHMTKKLLFQRSKLHSSPSPSTSMRNTVSSRLQNIRPYINDTCCTTRKDKSSFFFVQFVKHQKAQKKQFQ